jgi:sterol desaturase/sphingolipid hydroxylase (fatty acid hydroxylase superfamily)
VDAVPNFSRLYWDLFLTAFFVIALWESFQPRRRPTVAPAGRWGRHAALAALSSVAGLLFRTSPILVAAAVASSPYGLLNRSPAPFWVRCLVAVLLLDLARYLQHRLMHSWPVLWRLHQVHHSDEDFDLTTGLRFHPLEAVLTQGSYLGVVAVLAPPVEAVLVAELATVVQNFFAHANARIPAFIERPLRRVLVTPEMHRVHHSVEIDEQNTNFGSILPFWDSLFRTYRAAPRDHDTLRFGLKELAPGTDLPMRVLLSMPFAGRRRRRNGPEP